MYTFVKSKIGLAIVIIMVALVFTLLLPPNARVEAGFSPTLNSQRASSEELDQMKVQLESKKVSGVFEELGYDDQEIKSRMAGLNSEEISLLAGDLENSMTPSGDGTVILVVALSALIFAILGIFVLNWWKSYKYSR
jgi:hypothetical protein